MLLPGCTKQNNPSAVTWHKFTSEKDHFSVMVPGKPLEESDNPSPDAFHYFYFQVSEKNSSYLVSSGKLTDDPGVRNRLYDEIRDKTVGQYGKMLREKPMDICGFPGREVQLSADNGNSFAVTRFFIGKGHFYQELVVVPKESQGSTNIAVFLDSFNVLDLK